MASLPKQKLISPKETKTSLDRGEIILIDVREPSEYAAARLPSAKLVPLGSLKEASNGWKRDQTIVLYCQSGRRSEQARATLVQQGFAQLSSLEGGLQAWKADGLPIEKSANAPWSLERQVRFTVAIFVLLFTSLGLWIHPGFFLLNFLISGGLIFSAVTNTCGMALVLTKLPWNRVVAS